MLEELKTKEDVELFAKYKVDLIKLHQEYAKKLGLFDNKVDSYNKDDALKHLNQKDHYQFLIKEDNKDIGILEYKVTKSDIDNSKIIYINVLYIIEEYRKSGIGKKIIKELQNKHYRIELECWYEMPANYFYETLGMKKIKTRYMLESNNE